MNSKSSKQKAVIIILIVSAISSPTIMAITIFTGALSINPGTGIGLLIRAIIGSIIMLGVASKLARKWNYERQLKDIEDFKQALRRSQEGNT